MKARKPLRTSPREDATDPRTGIAGPARRLRTALLAVVAVLGSVAPTTAQSDLFDMLRSDMVENQIRKRGIKDTSILAAMKRVPRHRFVPESPARQAYDDAPVEFAPGHSLPQAYLSAQMIRLLNLRGDEKVLEIGTGSGYDAAVLSRLAKEVYSIDIDPGHVERARKVLGDLGYTNVYLKAGDGYQGWPEKEPFDAILLTAAPASLPDALLEQLAVGGRMVVAVGGDILQNLQVITMTDDGPVRRRISPVVIEPMIDPQRD